MEAEKQKKYKNYENMIFVLFYHCCMGPAHCLAFN